MTPPDPDRSIAGLRCREVLERLSSYLDGELPAAETHQVEAHVAGCDWCEKFGGELASTVQALRQTLSPPLPAEELERQRQRWRAVVGSR